MSKFQEESSILKVEFLTCQSDLNPYHKRGFSDSQSSTTVHGQSFEKTLLAINPIDLGLSQ